MIDLMNWRLTIADSFWMVMINYFYGNTVLISWMSLKLEFYYRKFLKVSEFVAKIINFLMNFMFFYLYQKMYCLQFQNNIWLEFYSNDNSPISIARRLTFQLHPRALQIVIHFHLF
jgi:hypothetical protein